MKRFFTKILCGTIPLLPIAVFGIDQAVQVIQFNEKTPRPWFTGPLLSPSGYVVPPGHINIQPYYYFSTASYVYNNSWKKISIPTLRTQLIQVPFKVGVIKNLDLGANPTVIGQHRKGQSNWDISDCTVSAGLQLLNATLEDPWPAIKLSLRTTLPLGKYQKLNPKKLRTDISGNGNFSPGTGLVATRLWHLKGIHYFELRASMFYLFSTHVKVRGESLYSLSTLSRGTVKPGNVFLVNTAIQYNFSKNWAFACDAVYRRQGSCRYSGRFAASDPIVKENKHSSANVSLAPAIEYNFTENIGMIGGCWFSVAGKNSLKFTTGAISLNVYI